MIITRAQDAYIVDEHNHKYIDTSMGSGSQIIGHGNILSQQIAKQINHGTIYSIPNHHTKIVSRLLKDYITPKLSNSYIFCSSGTEANMRAIRLARAYTQKEKIGRFHGGWHGGIDGFIESQGVPVSTEQNIQILPYNEDICFSMLTPELAAVIIEPIQGSNPQSGIGSFLKKLEKECKSKGILLITDEILTGFRLAKGGGCELFGLCPDIVTFGKVLGGGFPIGVVGAKEEIIRTPNVFYGGTFSANPLSMFAAKKILEDITINESENSLINYKKLNYLGEYFRKDLNTFFMDNNHSMRVYGCGSINRIIFSDKPVRNRKERDSLETKNQKGFYELLLKEGLFVNTNGIINLSMCHMKVMDKMIHKIKKIVNEIRI